MSGRFLGDVLKPLSLGCEEDLRLFLLGKARFPENATLTIRVTTETKIIPGSFQPVRLVNAGNERFEVFKLYVSGIEYMLCVGPDIPEGVRVTAATTPPDHCIMLTPDAMTMARKLFTEHLNKSKMSAGMKTTLEEIRQIKSKTSSRE